MHSGTPVPTTAEPQVSVIMNCYNGAKYLRFAVDSVLSQSYQEWELIFWDNQSTDQSAEIFKSYRDSRLKYFYAPKHTLLYEARNFAIERSMGSFLAFLDVDDVWHQDKLAKQLPLFEDPIVGFVCSNYWIVNENTHKRDRFTNKEISGGWVLNDLLSKHPPGLLTLVIRRVAFDSLQTGCDPRFHVIGDTDLLVRLALRWKMACCQEPLADYRIHGENEGAKQKKRHVAEFQVWINELGQNDHIRSLPGFSKLIREAEYMKGQLCLRENDLSQAVRHARHLRWGKYKLKLIVLIIDACARRILHPAQTSAV
jgi:glycosyltransferase involved in cell wall biosynthesis